MTYKELSEYKLAWLNEHLSEDTTKKYHLLYEYGGVCLTIRDDVTGSCEYLSGHMTRRQMYETLSVLVNYENRKGDMA